ncbi:MAG: helicase RepA family protein [Bdellovibrio sp.]|nr:helicase RepA family protein [Bdellovibrio sp.]
MIIINTLSRSLVGGEENSSADMGSFLKNIDMLRQSTNTVVVHHSGNDVNRGARGLHSLKQLWTQSCLWPLVPRKTCYLLCVAISPE